MNFKITVRFFSLMLLSLFFLPESAKAQVNKWNLGDSIQEKRASALLQMIEKGDEASIRQFLNEHAAPDFRDSAPMEAHITRFQRIKQSSGGMQIVAVEKPKPNTLVIILKMNDGRFVQLDVEMEAEPPNRILGISRRQARAPGSALQFTSFEELDRQLSKMTAEDRFSGVVLIGEENKIAFQKAYGMADRENRTLNRLDTMFDIGSFNKMFTSVAILRLAQEGKINLDDRLGKYLKGFPLEIANKVTIRQLLQMRSGLGDWIGNQKLTENVKRFRKVDDYLEMARTLPLKFEPGTGEAYNNLGYVVLGAVIEAVTKRSYYDVIEDYVYKPAGMKSTGSFERGKGKNIAISYTRRKEGDPSPRSLTAPLVSSVSYFPPVGSPAGGGFSTSEDIKRFCEAFFANRLLREDFTNLLLNQYEKVKEAKPPRSLAAGGGADGVSMFVIVNAETGRLVIVLTNFDRPIASDVSRDIFAQLNKNSVAKSDKP
ncbi:MAG TPA: serine hydrolase domain-containing protein [Pyrinomonadaceae bacterium]|jgi:CubicO group peptidase (beta-lactamase class C family)